MLRIYEEQPISSPGTWNRMEYRPLEGFVFAVTPFNFTAIAANLPSSAALMGNTVLWKPASTAAYSAHFLMKLFEEAGLPPGVINLVYGSGSEIGDPALASSNLAGVHFTGSTPVFQSIWKTIGDNIAQYRNYPRIVGETGGKDFIVAHPSADAEAVATAIVRGSFEYQGQKCSAASRVFAPSNLWPEIRERLVEQVRTIKMGDPADFENFMGAVIDAGSFRTQKEAIEEAKAAAKVNVLVGGGYDDSEGFFVEPTVIETDDPNFRTMKDELFGPVVTTYVYPAAKYGETLELVDQGAPYGLTGAVFAREREAVELAQEKLRYAAGNFYVNDKPTGAIVGQQPFGGARASGTNDKAGSMWNLIRWVSPRTIKETFVPPKDYRYPFMARDQDGSAPDPARCDSPGCSLRAARRSSWRPRPVPGGSSGHVAPISYSEPLARTGSSHEGAVTGSTSPEGAGTRSRAGPASTSPRPTRPTALLPTASGSAAGSRPIRSGAVARCTPPRQSRTASRGDPRSSPPTRWAASPRAAPRTSASRSRPTAAGPGARASSPASPSPPGPAACSRAPAIPPSPTTPHTASG